MTDLNSSTTIKEGDRVVIRKDKNLKVVALRRNSKLWIERAKFFMDSAIGCPYGSSFEVVGQKLVRLDKHDMDGDVDLDEEDEQMKDNRNLNDTSENQKLTSDTIRTMRKEGVHGEEIVEQLIQNSATFNQKNEFARQKYIKKKKKKYLPIIKLLKPNARLLLEMYYNKGPQRICNMRIDSLGQILASANVQTGGKFLVVESCVGLVVGAIMERMGGEGQVIQIFSGSAPVQQAVEFLHFPKDFHTNLHNYPMNKISKLGMPSDLPTEPVGTIQVPESSLERETVDDRVVEDMQTESIDQTVEQDEDCIEDDEDVKADSCDDCGQPNSKGVKRKFQQMSEGDRKKRWLERQKQIEGVKVMIEQADSDGLIVVTKFHPTPIVMSLIDFVAPSRPIAVFCQYKEPLIDCYQHLRDRGGVVLLKLTETWLRGYQVLPNRTHPTINMSGTGGYLLTGTTVIL